MANASGLSSLTRDSGGAVDLALINTVTNDRLDLHLMRLRKSVSWTDQTALATLKASTLRFGDFGSDACKAALKLLSVTVRR